MPETTESWLLRGTEARIHGSPVPGSPGLCHCRTTGWLKRQSFCQCGVSHLSGSLILWYTYLEHFLCILFSSLQSLSHVQLFATPWTVACQASLSITNSWSLLRLMSIESVMPSNHLILCHPLLLLPSIFPIIKFFSNESTLHMRWPKYWSFSFNISPSNEHPGLISFRMDWLDLLAIQGTLKSLLQTTLNVTSYSTMLPM